jgi:hypothetical protein
MWIDGNGDGIFETSWPEFVNHNWGDGPPVTPTAGASPVLVPGVYKIQIQYEEGFGANTIQLLSDTAPIVRTAYLVRSNRAPQCRLHSESWKERGRGTGEG